MPNISFKKIALILLTLFSFQAESAYIADTLNSEPEGFIFDYKALIDPPLTNENNNIRSLELSREGLKHLEKGDIVEALKKLEAAWNMNPDLVKIGVLVSFIHLKTNDFSKALDIAKKVQAIQPNNPYGYTLAGIAFGGLSNIEQSKAFFMKALEVSPGDPNASENLAALAFAKGEYDRARALYRTVLNYNPGHLSTMLKFAELEDRTKNSDQAMALLIQAIDANPWAPEPRIIIARKLLVAGNALDALKYAEPMRTQLVDSAEVLEILGRGELMSGKAGAAIQTLDSWAKLKPESELPHFYLANAFEHQGKKEQAIQELNIALGLNPQHRPSKLAKARLLLSLGEKEKALNIYNELFKQDPNSRNLIVLARAQWSIGNHDESVKQLEKWLNKNSNDVLVRTELANNYLKLKRLEDAKNMYNEILKLEENNIVALNNMAFLSLNEDPKKALKFAEKAYSIAPESINVVDTLAATLVGIGKSEQAIHMVDNALKSNPKNSTLIRRRAMIFEYREKINK